MIDICLSEGHVSVHQGVIKEQPPARNLSVTIGRVLRGTNVAKATVLVCTQNYFITIKELCYVGSVTKLVFTFLMRSREGLGALYYKTDEQGLSLVHC